MVNVCTRCDTVFFDGDIFCGKCGVKLEVQETPQYMTQPGLNVAEVRSNLGVVYFKMGRFPEALNEFKKVLLRDPNDARALEMIKQIEEQQESIQ